MAKHIFITGGVVSGLGKGITAVSLRRLLKAQGLRVALQKFGPCPSTDPDTMNPYQHGEVFVTEDGAETDLGLGHCKRFTDGDLTVDSSITSGKVYQSVFSQERERVFLRSIVQVIPHVTSKIEERIYRIGRREEIDVVITEIDGTVGDIEPQPFLKAIRQVAVGVGRQNVLYLHVSLIVSTPDAGKPRGRPIQHSIEELLGLGVRPDVILYHYDGPVSQKMRDRTALSYSAPPERVISNETAPILYEVPLILKETGLVETVYEVLGLPFSEPYLKEWYAMVERIKRPAGRLEITPVREYVALYDAYISVVEALTHGGVENGVQVDVRRMDSEDINDGNAAELLTGCAGIIVPGSFGNRGIKGMISTVCWTHEDQAPHLDICLGMQMAMAEFTRHVAGLANTHSSELATTAHPVIDLILGQQDITDKGGTMCLGAYPCYVATYDARAYRVYGAEDIFERHHHRYESNNDFRSLLAERGLVLFGLSPGGKLVETVELPGHPWFLVVQFHPELRSRSNKAHPLSRDFVVVAKDYSGGGARREINSLNSMEG